MKLNLICFFLLSFIIIRAQAGFDVIYEADYKLVYKNQTKNSVVQNAAYALLINNEESYYKNMNKYVEDSLRYEKKINHKTNVGELLKYSAEFPENIGTTSAKFYVTIQTLDKSFRYEETNNMSWKLVNEFKTIGKYRCQKAVTTKYGRNWIAYFTKDIPFPYGPYKFNKLPGLILEVYDDKKDYVFTMYSFRKRKYYCKSANMESKAPLVKKSKIFDYQRKELADTSKLSQFISDPESLNEVIKGAMERSKNYNPIELKID